MRIIAGTFRGRRLKPPGGPARATADRVREAWFSILGAEVQDAAIADLFAGSGALGLEALSRGAAHVTFVEQARRSLAALDANIASLGVEDRVTVERADVFRVLRAEPPSFDIALADPPFGTDAAGRLVQLFRERPFARILCVEHAARTPIDGDDHRRYGDTALSFLYAA